MVELRLVDEHGDMVQMNMATWSDIERAMNRLEDLDKETLEAFVRVMPEPSENPSYRHRFDKRRSVSGIDWSRFARTRRNQFRPQSHGTRNHWVSWPSVLLVEYLYF
jgi:hypothetical protein